ncbi:MAG TPA: response regulator, partial [Gemmatimonadales bacterium]
VRRIIFSLTTWCPVGHRILVVDDEPALRTILARAFRQRGCETLEACDEVAALKAALSASPPFDLVVTNSRMPHLDGLHLAAALHQADPGLPVMHLFRTCFKPFNLEDLLDEADEMMRAGEAKTS